MAKKSAEPAPPQKQLYLPTGSVLLNMAISGKPSRGIPAGHYTLFVGDSGSAKTWWALTMLAEAANRPAFDDYQLIHDNVENGALMDIEACFGKKLAARLRTPAEIDGEPVNSQTSDEFYFNVHAALQRGPCIYILDSTDSLSTNYEQKKFKERQNAAKKGQPAKGSYGDGKAKAHSEGLRQILPLLKKTHSVLIIISQTRDNIDEFSFETKTRAGGRALKFYAAAEVWTSITGTLKKKFRDIDRKIGTKLRATVKKNRVSGRDWSVDIPFITGYGLDDIGSCIDFLVKEKHWKSTEGRIVATELGLSTSRAKLISEIEEKGLQKVLIGAVMETWKEIEEALDPGRKKRYE